MDKAFEDLQNETGQLRKMAISESLNYQKAEKWLCYWV